MPKNNLLQKAKKNKADDFYTQLSDVENELRHYKDHFKGKVVLCNCDDPRVSSFFTYFSLNYHKLGLKKLITTCYKNDQPDLFSSQKTETAIWLEYDGTQNANGIPSPEEIGIHPLNGNGDFRSPECIEFLKQADIVVTNPPFSLFSDFVSLLLEYNKKFLIIGHHNAITYKTIFPLIKDNKLWLGYGFKGDAGYFMSEYEDTARAGTHKEGMIRVSGVNWFTNLEHQKRNEPMFLFKKYNPADYPKYDNYDAIEVNRTENIPDDYFDVMGVPITYMGKYCPEQFEILGVTESEGKGFSNGLWNSESGISQATINGQKVYKRIFIRRKPQK